MADPSNSSPNGGRGLKCERDLSPWVRSHKFVTALIASVGAGILSVGILMVPHGFVETPGEGTSPERVVRDYLDAINDRDFGAANVIASRTEPPLHFWDFPGKWTHVKDWREYTEDNGQVSVIFSFVPQGVTGFTDGERQDFGFYLKQQGGVWRIVDTGVA